LRSRSLQALEFGISGLRCIDEELAARGKRAEFVFQAQALQLESCTNRHKHVIALGFGRLCWRLGYFHF
jgi:hypothetical protein